jgi:hypothetical protein
MENEKRLDEELEDIEKGFVFGSSYISSRRIFRATYQDKALNRSVVEFEAFSWADAVVKALEKKCADQKLLTIEYVRDCV